MSTLKVSVPQGVTASSAAWAAASSGASTASRVPKASASATSGALGAHSATDLTGSPSASPTSRAQSLAAPQAVPQSLSAGQRACICCLQCIGCIVAVAVFVFAVMNLHGSQSDFTTGAIFTAAAGFSIVATIYNLYTLKSVASPGVQNVIPWQKIAAFIVLTTLPLLAGGVLGLTGVINNQTLGWFFFGPMLAAIPLGCVLGCCLGAKALGFANMNPQQKRQWIREQARDNRELAKEVIQGLAATQPALVQRAINDLANDDRAAVGYLTDLATDNPEFVRQVAATFAPTHPNLVRQVATTLAANSQQALAGQLRALLPANPNS